MARKANEAAQAAGADGGAEVSFEQVLQRLEQVVERLEHGDLALEESLVLFEQGVRLSRDGARRLDEAERRVESLLATDDQVKTVPFDSSQAEPR